MVIDPEDLVTYPETETEEECHEEVVITIFVQYGAMEGVGGGRDHVILKTQ